MTKLQRNNYLSNKKRKKINTTLSFLQVIRNFARNKKNESMKPNIITGQYVQISQTPASVWARIAGRLIDQIVLFTYTFMMIYLIDLADWSPETQTDWLMLFVAILPITFYTPAMEMMNNGRTIGKMAMRCRVVMADGSSPSIGALLMRWVMMPFDLYLSGGLGIFFIVFTKNQQRIGDLAAGTMVIKEGGYEQFSVSLDEFTHISRNYTPHYPQAALLTQGQADVIERVIRTSSLERDGERIAALATKIRQTLDIQSNERSDIGFLYTLLHDYQYYLLEVV